MRNSVPIDSIHFDLNLESDRLKISYFGEFRLFVCRFSFYRDLLFKRVGKCHGLHVKGCKVLYSVAYN